MEAMSWSELEEIRDEMEESRMFPMIRGELIEEPMRMRVYLHDSDSDKMEQDRYSAHCAIISASDGILCSQGIPYVDCCESYTYLIARIGLLRGSVGPSHDPGYCFPSTDGLFREFVIPRNVLVGVVNGMVASGVSV